MLMSWPEPPCRRNSFAMATDLATSAIPGAAPSCSVRHDWIDPDEADVATAIPGGQAHPAEDRRQFGVRIDWLVARGHCLFESIGKHLLPLPHPCCTSLPSRSSNRSANTRALLLATGALQRAVNSPDGSLTYT